MTTEYAKIRVAFGKPIGSYQGVKHRAADMLVESENAKSLTYYAAWAVDENVPEAPLAASMAKAYASDAFRQDRRRRHPAARRHRLHLGARPASLLQARQVVGVHVRRRDVPPRAGRSADQSCSASILLEGHDRSVPARGGCLSSRYRTVIVASLMCWPVAQAFVRAEGPARPSPRWPPSLRGHGPVACRRRTFFVLALAMVSSSCCAVSVTCDDLGLALFASPVPRLALAASSRNVSRCFDGAAPGVGRLARVETDLDSSSVRSARARPPCAR